MARYNAIFLASAVHAQELRKDAVVRIEGSGIESGWHEGRIGKGGPCTMVFLKTKTKAGYTSLALDAVRRMQRQDGRDGIDVDVKPALAREPKECREPANERRTAFSPPAGRVTEITDLPPRSP